jgi:addiction module RelE/StbE family toxin
MAQIIWSARSVKDIDEIAEYIAKNSLVYAEEQVKQFFEKASVLEQHPLIGRVVPELKIPTIRQILCGHYRIIYEIIDEERIGIVTVHHAARLLKNNKGVKKILRSRRR